MSDLSGLLGLAFGLCFFLIIDLRFKVKKLRQDARVLSHITGRYNINDRLMFEPRKAQSLSESAKTEGE